MFLLIASRWPRLCHFHPERSDRPG